MHGGGLKQALEGVPRQDRARIEFTEGNVEGERVMFEAYASTGTLPARPE